MKTIDYINKWLKENLSEKRYNHSQGTADTAKKLAKLYNIDENKAYLAGLLHDSAKNHKDDVLYKIIIDEIKVGFDKTELKNPKTYHAIVSAYFAKTIFEVDDDEIISSIRNHTIGKKDMTIFEKIIFLADKIEPNTREKEYSKQLWEYIEKYQGIMGLDMALFRCFSETIKSLVERKLYICPMTIDVYNEYLEKCIDFINQH